MSSVKWFDGNSVQALEEMKEKNCAFFVYIAKANKGLEDVFHDPDIIQLLNNELIICFKMIPESASFENFNKIFNNIIIPSIYVLEKNNTEQFNIIIKKSDLLNVHEVQLDFLDLKIQILNSIYNTIKNISDSLEDDLNDKQKYLQFMNDVSDKMQSPIIKRQKVIKDIQNLVEYTKIKIKIPCNSVTLVQEFPITNTLNEVKLFILNNGSVPKGPIKLIAHRQFVSEDFSQTLDALNLCPSSTIYVHTVPSDQYQPILFDFQSWLWRLFNFAVLNPFNYVKNIIKPAGVEQRKLDQPNKATKNKKKFSFKSNIHTLRNDNSDDENNTYNGNSTQQM